MKRSEQDRQDHHKRLGELVKHLRSEAGLTRRELGRRARLTDAIIRAVEHGTALLRKAEWERLALARGMERLSTRVRQEAIVIEFADAPSGEGT